MFPPFSGLEAGGHLVVFRHLNLDTGYVRTHVPRTPYYCRYYTLCNDLYGGLNSLVFTMPGGQGLRLQGLLTFVIAPTAALGLYTTSPEKFGAVGDGKANDWSAVQAAVSSCSFQDDACKVVFAKSYLSGPVRVNASGVTLEVTGSLYMLNKKDFDISHRFNFISNSVPLRNFRLTGSGIVGNASPEATLLWWTCKLTGCFRPHLVTVSNSINVRIDGGITFENSPNHNIELNNNSLVRVDNIHVKAPHTSPNTDGINFYGGHDQSFTNSFVSNGDDCVSVVPINEFAAECSAEPSDIEACRGGNLHVSNVTCIGGHGIAIGGVRHGTVSNVTFKNMTATRGTGVDTQGLYSPGGLRIKSYPNSTGSVYDVLYEDIVIDGVYTPISVLGHYCPWPCNTPDGNQSTLFRDIVFRNIRGGGRNKKQGEFVCSSIEPCQNITLENVTLFKDSDTKEGGTFTCGHVELHAINSFPDSCSNAGRLF